MKERTEKKQENKKETKSERYSCERLSPESDDKTHIFECTKEE